MPEAVSVETRTDAGMVTLRGDLAAPPVREAVRAATGCEVPSPRRFTSSGGRGAAWMAPDELMLFVPRADAADIAACAGRALEGAHHLVVDVSDARAVFRLAGAGAREVLAKGAPVDLAQVGFGVGDFRRTRLGQVAVALWMPAPATFELMCFRSVAGFVRDWLDHAARPEARLSVFPDAG